MTTRMPEILGTDFHYEVCLVTNRLPYWVADYLEQRLQKVFGRLFTCEGAQAGPAKNWRCWWERRTGRGQPDYRKIAQKEVQAAARELGIPCRLKEPYWGGSAVDARLSAQAADTLPGGWWDTVTSSDEIDRWHQIRSDIDKVIRWFSGRRLREEELFRLVWRRSARWRTSLEEVLEYACLSGEITRTPGVVYRGHGWWQCSRCGEKRNIEIANDCCPLCGQIGCPVCRACMGMGLVRGCEPVYEFNATSANSAASAISVSPLVSAGGRKGRVADLPSREQSEAPERRTSGNVEPCFAFPLAESQAKASQQLVRFLESEKRSCLLWAVCGAGKTETVFAAMAKALASGQHVLFAIPRRDVVLELAPRLQKAFPSRRLTVLVGGQGTAEELGEIVVATTHQALRLAAVFGLVILDEADAFPYASDPALVRAVQRCAAPAGKQIIMTATPDAAHLLNARTGAWELVVIPIRHHGHLLPVPQILLHRSWRLPKPGVRLLFPPVKHIRYSGTCIGDDAALSREKEILWGQFPLMIFVPTVAHGHFLHRYLLEHWPEVRVEFVYANHPRRDQLIDAFRSGQIPVLVCTSILARGVTIPHVNVWVAWADVEFVLDTANLVQMAGRVGRTADSPGGEVWFLAGHQTKSMQQAVDMIRQANLWAQGASCDILG